MNDVKLLLKIHRSWEIEDLEQDRYLYYAEFALGGPRWIVDKLVTTKDGHHNRKEIFSSAEFEQALNVFTTGKVPTKEKSNG